MFDNNNDSEVVMVAQAVSQKTEKMVEYIRTLKINKPYLIKPAYHSKWGFSTRGRVNKTWKMLEMV